MRFFIFAALMVFSFLASAQSSPQTKILLTCQQKWDILQVSDDGLGYIRIRRTLVDGPAYTTVGPQPTGNNAPMYFRTADSKSFDAIIDGTATTSAQQMVITAKNKTTLTLSVSRPQEGEAMLSLASSDAYLQPAVMKQLQAAGQNDFDYFVGDCDITP